MIDAIKNDKTEGQCDNLPLYSMHYVLLLFKDDLTLQMFGEAKCTVNIFQTEYVEGPKSPVQAFFVLLTFSIYLFICLLFIYFDSILRTVRRMHILRLHYVMKGDDDFILIARHSTM